MTAAPKKVQKYQFTQKCCYLKWTFLKLFSGTAIVRKYSPNDIKEIDVKNMV